MRTEASRALFDRARKVMPGGVNSPVRAFRAVGGEPRFMARGSGARIWDEDANEYLDYVGSWGPLVLGHAHPAVVEAIREAAVRGTSFGAPSRLEVELAEEVRRAIPSVEVVRMVSSGTEATMSALRLARAFTGRTKVVKFEGCYHGHADPFLIRAGSGATTFGTPDSPGVTPGTAADTLCARYNDLDSVGALFATAEARNVAAVIVEPVAANMGVVPPVPGFLEGLRRLCDDHGALLVFDEVITGFRLPWDRDRPPADLTTLGKVLGGGMPVGAYGGRADVMRLVAPEGPVYQAGTLSGNPVAMSAGLATLRVLAATKDAHQRLEARARSLEEGLAAAIRETSTEASVARVGSLLTLFFCAPAPADYDQARRADTARFGRFFQAMLARGVYLPPAQFEAWFVSLAHTEEDVARTVAAAREALAESR